jgi:hypothetical protein
MSLILSAGRLMAAGFSAGEAQLLTGLTGFGLSWQIGPGEFLYESASDGLTAHAGGGQASALALTSEMNRIATVATAGDSVALPASAPGLTVIIENAGANPAQVYGAGTDTINGVATATGVSQMAGSVVIYTCYTAGAWYANGLGTGYAGSLETQSTATGITAHAGGGQASATQIAAMMNNITTVATTNDSVVLPASAVGLQITVANNGTQTAAIFCPVGSTMNGVANGSVTLAAGSVGIYFCVAPLVWISK